MKTFRILFTAALIAAFSACQKDINIEQGDGNQALEHLTISTSSTKTFVSGDEIHWSNNDEIKIFDNKGGVNTFSAEEIEGSHASFSGYVTARATEFFAVYPADKAISASGNTVKITVPANQEPKSESFAEGHNVAVAAGNRKIGQDIAEGVTFFNMCSWLKFTLPEYIGDAQKVTISSKSYIAGDMTVTYADGKFSSVLDEDLSTSISMTGEHAAGSTFWFVLAPVTIDGITVDVTTAKGSYSMSAEGMFEMTAAEYRNLGTLELKKVSATSASAKHVYEGGILTGTEVSVGLNIPEETLPYVTALNLTISKADGTVVRTVSKNTAAAVETIGPDANWPYLPTGEYKIGGTYTLSGTTQKGINEIAFTITEKPEFTVTLDGVYTSYTKYAAGDAAGANLLNGTSIYGVSANASISSSILNNQNYPSFVYSDNGSAVSEGTLSNRGLGEHTIKASYTLDGVTRESSANCHVTGLPYSYNFVDGSLDNYKKDGWTTNGSLRVSNETLAGRDKALVLQHRRYSKVIWVLFDENEKGFVVSPKFHIPSDISVQPSIHRSVYNAGGEITRTGYVGPVSNTTSTNTNSVQYSTKGSNSISEIVYGSDEWLSAFTLSNGSPYISIDCNTRNDKDLGCYYFLHEAHFRYAQ